MRELIAKLEAAEGPSRELDGEIAQLFGIEPHKTCLDYDYSDPRHTQMKWQTEYRYYTASIDAALTLVPEGARWIISTEEPGPWASVASDLGCMAATPALALCIAALKARDGGNG